MGGQKCEADEDDFIDEADDRGVVLHQPEGFVLHQYSIHSCAVDGQRQAQQRVRAVPGSIFCLSLLACDGNTK